MLSEISIFQTYHSKQVLGAKNPCWLDVIDGLCFATSCPSPLFLSLSLWLLHKQRQPSMVPALIALNYLQFQVQTRCQQLPHRILSSKRSEDEDNV